MFRFSTVEGLLPVGELSKVGLNYSFMYCGIVNDSIESISYDTLKDGIYFFKIGNTVSDNPFLPANAYTVCKIIVRTGGTNYYLMSIINLNNGEIKNRKGKNTGDGIIWESWNSDATFF